MKSNRILLIVLIAVLALPTINSCSVGEKDPFISLMSRNSRLSAVWTLKSGYSDEYLSLDEEFRWKDDDCEDAMDANGGMLSEEYRETDNQNKTFNYSDALVHYELLTTTTRDKFLDLTAGLLVDGKEYEDAWTIERDIHYKYEITIKKNGEYRVYVTYNLFDDDVPNVIDGDGDMQYGKTYTGTFEYVDNWRWTDNGLGGKEGVLFDGFPLPVVTNFPEYDQDLNYFNNYVSSINFSNTPMIFDLERLAKKEMTLIGQANENSFYQEVDNEYEAFLSGQSIDCEGTFTFTSVKNSNYYFQFISDGKSVDK